MKPIYQTNKIMSSVLSILLMLVSTLPLAAQEVAPQSKPGDLDTTFGNSGKVTASFMVGNEVAIQKDNKLIVSGSDLVARFNANGSLDMNFGKNGKVDALLPIINDMAIQADGKILVAGYVSKGGTNTNFGLARYNSDGTPDVTFGANGVASTDFFGFRDVINAIAIQPDGSIVAGGQTTINPSHIDFGLARFKANGALDSTFGIGGIVNTDMSGLADDYEDIKDLVIQPDGYIVVTGGVNRRTGCARYKPNGTLDNGFGFGGKVKILPDVSNVPQSVVLQADGRIVCAGGSLCPNGSFDFMMFRLLANGILDASFGNGGLVFTDFKTSSDTGFALTLLKDG